MSYGTRPHERLYLRRPTAEHRHYLLCRRCGRSRPVDAEVVEQWADRLGETTGFTELAHTLELSGLCGRCSTEGETPCRQALHLTDHQSCPA